MSRDWPEIQVASAVMFAISPLPNGVFASSSALKPCRVDMQVTRRDSTSCTRPVSAKYRGSSTHAPLTTPGPLPRSHFSRLTFFGPRGVFQSSSPFTSKSSAGFAVRQRLPVLLDLLDRVVTLGGHDRGCNRQARDDSR